MHASTIREHVCSVAQRLESELGEESIKWYLWHGNAFQALNKLQDLEVVLDAAGFKGKDESTRKLLEGVEELHI